jgi:hypothetical protein
VQFAQAWIRSAGVEGSNPVKYPAKTERARSAGVRLATIVEAGFVLAVLANNGIEGPPERAAREARERCKPCMKT